jgi:hypothetical protein
MIADVNMFGVHAVLVLLSESDHGLVIRRASNRTYYAHGRKNYTRFWLTGRSPDVSFVYAVIYR